MKGYNIFVAYATKDRIQRIQNMNFLRLIRQNCLFKDFNDSEINNLFDCMKGRIIMKSKGMLVAKEESKVSEICIILKGSLLKFITKLNGQKEPLKMLNAGDMYGLHQYYLSSRQLGFNLVAATDVTLLYLDTSTIVTMCEKACKHHQKLIHEAFKSLANKIEKLADNNNYIMIRGMRKKIAKIIYDKYLETRENVVYLGMDRNEMAHYLNVSRPSMSREMMRMRDEGIIDFWKDKITIRNINELEHIVKDVRI